MKGEIKHQIMQPITIHNQFMFFKIIWFLKIFLKFWNSFFVKTCGAFVQYSENLCIKCIKSHTKLLERDNEKLSTENNGRFSLMVLLLILNGQVQSIAMFKFYMALNVGKYIGFYWSFPHQSILLNSKETTIRFLLKVLVL